MGLAGYQQVKFGEVNKYVLGLLMVLALGSLGYRVDTWIELWLETKAGRRLRDDAEP